MLHPLSFLVKKFGHLAKKHNNTIYISCCYGATKEAEINGIKIIPLNYSRHVTSDLGWYIDNTNDFIKFYTNVVKTFRVKVKYFPTQEISEEEDYKNHGLNVTKAMVNTLRLEE